MDQQDRQDGQERNGSVGSPEVLEKASRRRFDGAYKLRILSEAEHCQASGQPHGNMTTTRVTRGYVPGVGTVTSSQSTRNVYSSNFSGGRPVNSPPSQRYGR